VGTKQGAQVTDMTIPVSLERLTPGASVRGIRPDEAVEVVAVEWHGDSALTLTYRTAAGQPQQELLSREDEARLEVVDKGRPWSFDGDGADYRLVAEAHRIRLAHLYDPVLAVHTSLLEPLPHQITAVYEEMLPRQPLRFLLADDPGAGKTIMAGLLIKELMVRGDLRRCLIVCPGSLAEQWQDELFQRFQLPFEILTNDKLEAARTGNWFLENHLVIARLDKLSRNEDVQAKLQADGTDWDLVIFDEAHKLSATFFSSEVKYTKRYRLGQLLGGRTRHLLLMTATPHNGKEEDFQLFMALLDADRFEGKPRDGVHTVAVDDLMRRMVKENLVRFDGTPLFPERRAHTVPFKLSDAEARLYHEVTEYVRTEWDRADKLQDDKRKGTVGFALTILQRRLASSPAAIAESLRRRRERLERQLADVELQRRGATLPFMSGGRLLDADDLEDLEDAPEDEIEAVEEEVLDQATAARTVNELKAEIATLTRLQDLANTIRRSGEDTKWRELAGLLGQIFTPAGIANQFAEGRTDGSDGAASFTPARDQKLVIFTEHRDTLEYLTTRIRTLLGQPEAVVTIHGSIGREDRLKTQELFRHDPMVRVMVATDAAGEGINLQRAHLMVNYDLPWNPNRLEQRFGRIHRIGQREVCHLWNLVATETREGDVYLRLLDKLEQARQALGGQVFDVLGQLTFEGKPLRDLLIEAIRYGERPEVRARLQTVIDTVDSARLQDLLSDHALSHDLLSQSRVLTIRQEMERAEARRLQPHFIEELFLEAFKRLGGTIRRREAGRHEITNVPGKIRARDRQIGTREAVLPRYDRVTFEKSGVNPEGQVPAAFVTPGHPLLTATLDLILEQHRDLLKRGTVLVDERDEGTTPRVLFTLEHAIRDASITPSGEQRVISRRMLHVEIAPDGAPRDIRNAPYLDYRPLGPDEPAAVELLAHSACAWIGAELEGKAKGHAIATLVKEHADEVKRRRLDWVTRTRAAVRDRLTKEITYWDSRASELRLAQEAGRPGGRLNAQEALKRADELQVRLKSRLDKLALEEQVSSAPPTMIGGLVVVPIGLLRQIRGEVPTEIGRPVDTQAAAARARAIVMDIERSMGFQPVDKELEKLGYDIESYDPETGHLRFIEVKGRVSGARDICVTKNEILCSLNTSRFILAIVEFLDETRHQVHYLREPFRREPDFGANSVNYDMDELIARAGPPAPWREA
jgi:superfamily II DNA or RNA helicase